MSEKDDKKAGSASELDVIKSALSINLDETTVDIFSGDLFGKGGAEKKKEPSEAEKGAEPASKPKERELKPVEAEEIKLPPSKISEPELRQKERSEAELSWEKPLIQKAKVPPSVVPKQTRGPAEGQTILSGKPAPKAKPVPEIELKIEAGEFHSVAAVKEEEKLEATSELLLKLEKMGDDFLSVEEMKKLFQNVNLMIELLNKALARIERLEQKLRDKGLI